MTFDQLEPSDQATWTRMTSLVVETGPSCARTRSAVKRAITPHASHATIDLGSRELLSARCCVVGGAATSVLAVVASGTSLTGSAGAMKGDFMIRSNGYRC